MTKLPLFAAITALAVVHIRAQNQYNPQDRDQYDRNRNQFNQSQPGRYDPYNRDSKGDYRDSNGNYRDGSGNFRDSNGNYRDPNGNYRDSNGNYRDANGNYRDNNNQYGGNQSQRDRYGNNQDHQYNVDRNDQYNRDGNRNQYSNNNNRDQYGNPIRDPNNNNNNYNNQNNQYGGGHNRDQYDRDRDQGYFNNGSRDQGYNNNGSRDPYNNNNYNNRDFNNNNNNNNRDFNRDRDRDRDYNNRNRDQYDQDRYDNRDRYETDQYSGGNNNNGNVQYNSNDNCCHEYCYTEDEQKYAHFATKTAYQVVYGQHSDQHKVPDCNPIQFWSINRHGTRYPSVNTIERLRTLTRFQQSILRNYDENKSYPDKGRLCPKDLELLRRWRWNETVNQQNANGLTEQGISDLKFLARRFASRFDELLKTPYDQNTHEFQYTDTDRTHDSYQAYIEGLFNNNAYQVHANRFNEGITRPTKSCTAWRRQVDDNPSTQYEFQRFHEKQEYKQLVRDVFRRLGFRYTLNETLIQDMYDLCRYEKAWDLLRPSAWCVVFNKEQLKLLEYAEDLKSYYRGGYGNRLSKDMGCPPLKDLYQKFERTVDGNGQGGNKVSVFFTHSNTIQTFLTAMGIARDGIPLTADNYYQQTRRQWRTSVIDPFGANLAAALYQCRTGERHRVMFFLNEIPVNYPDCQVGLCNWSTVKNKLQSAANYCNLDFCDRNSATVLEHSYVIYFLITTLYSFFLI